MERDMMTSTMTLKEEKDRVAKIQALGRQKEEVRAYHALKDSVAAEVDTAAWQEEIRTLDSEINAIKAAENELDRELNKIRAQTDTAVGDLPQLLAQRREMYDQLDKCHDQRKAARNAFAKERKAAYQARQVRLGCACV
jgi:chromosome segregation ATPase